MDGAENVVDVAPLLGATKARDTSGIIARRAETLLTQNRGVLRDVGISGHARTDGRRVELVLKTTTTIGAVPLRSPVTARADYGLVIRPRFGWSSAGHVLAHTGLAMSPSLLPLPMLPRSERRVPPWVLSSVVLKRARDLLDQMSRKFQLVTESRRAPRGSVNWGAYAVTSIGRGRPEDIPCQFPDLRDDEELRAALHHVLLRHHHALLGQRTEAVFVRQLVAHCEELLARVHRTPPRRPTKDRTLGWSRSPNQTDVFRRGIEAIEWTVEDRGLAGLSDSGGLAWRLQMEELFEAWAVQIVEALAQQTGGSVSAGSTGRTKRRLHWTPKFSGSQSALIPDAVLEREDEVFVFDAKYKRHLEEIDLVGWRNVGDQLREHHRDDLLQVLAYTTMFDTKRVVAVLVYPCSQETWKSLVRRGVVARRGELIGTPRNVEVVLTAAPMMLKPGDVASEWRPAFSTQPGLA